MSKRNAFRMYTGNVQEDIAFTVERYGPIEENVYNEIVAWLKNHKNEYSYSAGMESVKNSNGELLCYRIIKVQRKGSFIEKVLDNQHDALNTLANIRNPDFPKNKQGE